VLRCSTRGWRGANCLLRCKDFRNSIEAHGARWKTYNNILLCHTGKAFNTRMPANRSAQLCSQSRFEIYLEINRFK
jgi:hypothetical protein